MRLVGKTMIPAALMLRSGLVLSAMHAEAAPAGGTDLPGHADVEGLTSYLYAIIQGMAVQAGAGATREELERLIATSMAMWPSA